MDRPSSSSDQSLSRQGRLERRDLTRFFRPERSRSAPPDLESNRIQQEAQLRENIQSLPRDMQKKILGATLVELLGNERIDWNVRYRIARAIGKLGDKEVVPRLVEMLPNEEIDKDVRYRIARTIGGLGDEKVVPRLVEMLPNEEIDKDVRCDIVDEAIGKLGDKEVVPRLVEMLPNEEIDKDVRCDIVDKVIVKLGDKEVIPRLVEMRSDGRIDPGVRASIGRVISELYRLYDR
jgi:HEAT repeat protein